LDIENIAVGKSFIVLYISQLYFSLGASGKIDIDLAPNVRPKCFCRILNNQCSYINKTWR